MPFLVVTQQPRQYTGEPFAPGHNGWRGPTVGQLLPLEADEMVMGRDPGGLRAYHPGTTVLYLPFPPINRFHARLRRVVEGYVLEDMHSRNGTYVNGIQIDAVTLKDGDRIRLTEFEFIFRVGKMESTEKDERGEQGAVADRPRE